MELEAWVHDAGPPPDLAGAVDEPWFPLTYLPSSTLGEEFKHAWIEEMDFDPRPVFAAVRVPVLAFYGRSLDWFLHRRWISAAIWAVCLAGTVVLFIVVPKTFLPAGDSGVVNGVFIAQEGSSPQQMQALQEKVGQAVRDEPSVDRAISVTGFSQFLSSNQGLTYIFLKPGEKRPPVSAVAGSLMGRIASIPGVFPFLRPYPVLQIRRKPDSIIDYEYEDFEVVDYQCHPHIAGKVSK